MVKYNLIVAMCRNNGIGFKNKIPWNIKSDMKYFSEITKGDGNNAVIMGNKTFESLPVKNGKYGLNSRDNYVLTYSQNNKNNIEKISSNIKVFNSVNELDNFLNEQDNYEDIWVIGGASIYSQYLDMNKINKCYVTYIDKHFECDTFFPILVSDQWAEIDREDTYDVTNSCDVNYIVYEKVEV
jgi:dihydrofolate reductase